MPQFYTLQEYGDPSSRMGSLTPAELRADTNAHFRMTGGASRDMQEAMRTFIPGMWNREPPAAATCSRGDQCGQQHSTRQLILCAQCGRCSACRWHCDHSTRQRAEGDAVLCCRCSQTNRQHGHCSNCNELLSAESNLCDSCFNDQQVSDEEEENDYSYTGRDVSMHSYTCLTCNIELGACTCTLAYL